MPLMITTALVVNGARRSVNAHPDMPLLWVLRENLKLTGTKLSRISAHALHPGYGLLAVSPSSLQESS